MALRKPMLEIFTLKTPDRAFTATIENYRVNFHDITVLISPYVFLRRLFSYQAVGFVELETKRFKPG